MIAGLPNLPAVREWPSFDEASTDVKLSQMAQPGQPADSGVVRAALEQATQRHAQQLDAYYYEQLTAYLERMKVPDMRPDIERTVDQSLIELKTLVDQNTVALRAFENDYAGRQADYLHFRESNGLVREPHYPEGRLRHALAAICVGLVETVLNGNVLAIGATGGLIQGWSIAAMVSAVNVGCAFCGGNTSRFVNDRSWVRRSLGFFSVGACSIVLVLFNLLVAHYREALLGSEGYAETLEAGQRAWEAFSAGYFGVSDFMSWILFAMGMMAAGLGAWKGFTLEDSCPGYSRRARALKDVEADWREARERGVDDVAQLQSESASRINQYGHDHETNRATAETARTSASRLRDRLCRERAKLLADVEFLQARHCPNEEPITLGAMPAEQELPPVDFVDSAVVADCARSNLENLAARCSAAVNALTTPG